MVHHEEGLLNCIRLKLAIILWVWVYYFGKIVTIRCASVNKGYRHYTKAKKCSLLSAFTLEISRGVSYCMLTPSRIFDGCISWWMSLHNEMKVWFSACVSSSLSWMNVFSSSSFRVLVHSKHLAILQRFKPSADHSRTSNSWCFSAWLITEEKHALQLVHSLQNSGEKTTQQLECLWSLPRSGCDVGNVEMEQRKQ